MVAGIGWIIYKINDTLRPQWFDGYKQSNSATIPLKFFVLAQRLDNIINECYNDKLLEKTIMQI